MDPATISAVEALEALALANEQIKKATGYIQSQAKLENEKSSGSDASEPSNRHPIQSASTTSVVEKSLIPFGSGSLPNISYASILSESLISRQKETSKNPPLSISPSSSAFPPLGASSIPASLPLPINDIGKVFMVMGVTDTQLEYKALHKQMDKGVVIKGHMVVVNDMKMRNGLVYFAVGTFTTKHVPGLPAKYVVPIFPFTGDFNHHDSHDLQYRLENEDSTWTPNCGREYRRKTNKDSYLRQDNTFFLPKALTRPSDGEDGECVRLSGPSLTTYLEFLEKENIIEGSQADPLWKVGPPSPTSLLYTPTSGRGRGRSGTRGGRGGRGSGRVSRRGSHGVYSSGESSRGEYTPHGTPTKPKGYNKYPTPISRDSSPIVDSTPIPYSIHQKAAWKRQTKTLNLQDVFGPNSVDENEGWTQVSYSKTVKHGRSYLGGHSGKENVPLASKNTFSRLSETASPATSTSNEADKAKKARKVNKTNESSEDSKGWTKVWPSKAAKLGGGNLVGRGGKQSFVSNNPYAGLCK